MRTMGKIKYWWYGKTWKDFLCAILTFGHHKWKHFSGEARYVRCRICDRLPKGQWEQLQKLRGGCFVSQRTVQEFVEDYVSDGKSFKQIRMIAAATRWKTQKDEVKDEYRKLKKRMRQIQKRKKETNNGEE